MISRTGITCSVFPTTHNRKKCIFAAEMSARLRQITAWVLLLAFCGMTGTKALHHHH